MRSAPPRPHPRALRVEGLVLVVARNWRPRWVSFDDDDPDMLGITWQAWPLDRVLLSDLERPAWDEVAADLVRPDLRGGDDRLAIRGETPGFLF